MSLNSLDVNQENSHMVNAAYRAVFDLMLESENYLVSDLRSEAVDLPPTDRIFVIRQEMRITARLASAMAWLMSRKAAASGEIGPQDAVYHQDPFEEAACCLDTACHDDDRLPDRARDLLEQSYRLYVQVVEMHSATVAGNTVLQ